MKISLKFAEQLKQLSIGETFSINAFSGKNQKIIKQLITDGVLFDNKIIRRKKVIYCPDAEKLEKHIIANFEINTNLDEYIAVLQNENSTKSDMVNVSGSAKLKKTTSLDGFLIKTYQDIKGKIDNKEFNLKTIHGTSIHISDWENFTIENSATIVVVENSDNFKFIHQQKDLFESIKPIFVLRFANSKAISEWINTIENNYLHYGDFDLKGIHIYLTEFKEKIQEKRRCSFFIPDNIENILNKKGSSNRYYDQIENLKNFDFTAHKEIMTLVDIIEKHKKGLDQEFLIANR